MLVSEKYAKNIMYCPQKLTAINMLNSDSAKIYYMCEGPYCMAWRWKEVEHKRGFCGLSGPSSLLNDEPEENNESHQHEQIVQ